MDCAVRKSTTIEMVSASDVVLNTSIPWCEKIS